MTGRRPRTSVRVLATFAAIAASLASGPATAGSDSPVRSFSIDEAPHRSSSVASASGARPSERSVQYRGRVRVGADGNGATAASFPTTVAGDDVRYLLVLRADCTPTRCRPLVDEVDITLNDLVVHTTDTEGRQEIALNAIGAGQNQIVVTATGPPRAGARIQVVALRTGPDRVQYRGRVRVGADGNGATAASFPTTVTGDDVRYLLVLGADCTPTRCRRPVDELDITLNDHVVMHAGHPNGLRVIALNAIDAGQNRIAISATGPPRAGARIEILAFRL